MKQVVEEARRAVRYSVYAANAFGPVSLAAELEAVSDGEALRKARQLVCDGRGELRQGQRIVCRFGRAKGLMLQG